MRNVVKEQFITSIERTSLIRKVGRVTQFVGLVLEADGPDVFLGEQCFIYSQAGETSVKAEVIGIRNNRVLLMPYGDIRGIRFGSEVIATGSPVDVPVGDALLGRVVDAFCHPLDQLGPIELDLAYPAYGAFINPLDRAEITQVYETGIKAIDGLLPFGRGQRLGLFAGSGVGKSTLLSMIARNVDSDINVIALIGERGREVLEFIKNNLGEEGLSRSVVVVATSDQSPLLRSHAALTATAIAEYFRDKRRHVTLMMDSLTRYAMALRDIALSMGEPPTSRGYTPSVFAALPRLLERCGALREGSISAFYTVLVEGDDVNDPISDAVRAILDGHIVLSRLLAERSHYPAIDVTKSVSRLRGSLLTDNEKRASEKLQRMLSIYEQSKDLIEVGAYKKGLNPELDNILNRWTEIEGFLMQPESDCYSREATFSELSGLTGEKI